MSEPHTPFTVAFNMCVVQIFGHEIREQLSLSWVDILGAMHIALYAPVFPPGVGGTERFAQVMAGWLALQGHEVSVITAQTASSASDGRTAYTVIRRPSRSQTLRVFRDADVVHVNGLSLKGVALARAALRPCVVTHHQFGVLVDPASIGLPPRDINSGRVAGPGVQVRGRLALTHAAVHMAAANVCVSHYLAARLPVPRRMVIYAPVHQSMFASRPALANANHLIAFAGNLYSAKGLDLLLRAVALVPDFALHVAGAGPMEHEWKALSDRLGISSRVRFLGALELDGVIALYRRAMMVCIPSVLPETFGYAAAEAMALGCTVVATPCGAVQELLADGRGYVAKSMVPGDLADALRTAAGDTRRSDVAARGQAFAQSHFGVDAIGEQYLRLYRSSVRTDNPTA